MSLWIFRGLGSGSCRWGQVTCATTDPLQQARCRSSSTLWVNGRPLCEALDSGIKVSATALVGLIWRSSLQQVWGSLPLVISPTNRPVLLRHFVSEMCFRTRFSLSYGVVMLLSNRQLVVILVSSFSGGCGRWALLGLIKVVFLLWTIVSWNYDSTWNLRQDRSFSLFGYCLPAVKMADGANQVICSWVYSAKVGSECCALVLDENSCVLVVYFK